MKNLLKLCVTAAVVMTVAGCAHNAKTQGSNSMYGNGGSGVPMDQQLQATLNGLAKGNNVYFDFDKYTWKIKNPRLAAKNKYVLDKNTRVLLKYPQLKLTLCGYADPRGSEEYNFKLGQKRAVAVANYFASQGVSNMSSRVNVLSYGETKLVNPSNYMNSQLLASVGGNKQKANALALQKAYQEDRRTEISYSPVCPGAN